MSEMTDDEPISETPFEAVWTSAEIAVARVLRPMPGGRAAAGRWRRRGALALSATEIEAMALVLASLGLGRGLAPPPKQEGTPTHKETRDE